MSDNTPSLAIGIVAVITALGSAFVMICKYVKKSDCLGVHIETRSGNTPTIIAPPPSPINKIKNEDNNNIKEIEV